MIESLEGRSLLSAAPVLTYPYPTPFAQGSITAGESKPAVTASAPKAAATAKAKTKPASILGDWDGRLTVKVFPFKLKYDLSLEITKVGPSSARGTLTIDGDDYNGNWSGYTQKQKGYFSYTLKKHGDKVTITGTLNSKSTYAWGTIKVDWGWRQYKGDFTLNKW